MKEYYRIAFRSVQYTCPQHGLIMRYMLKETSYEGTNDECIEYTPLCLACCNMVEPELSKEYMFDM